MTVFVTIAFSVLALGAVLCLYRVGIGPTAPDRAVAIDMLGVLLVGFCTLLAVETRQHFYLNVAIAWALLNFLGAIALAKFLEGKGLDE